MAIINESLKENGLKIAPKPHMAQLAVEDNLMIIEKVINNKNQSIAKITATNNVSFSALERWLKLYKDGRFNLKKSTTSSYIAKLTAAAKLNHLLATFKLDDAQLGLIVENMVYIVFNYKSQKKVYYSMKIAKKST